MRIQNLSWPKSKEKILTSLLTVTRMKMNSKYCKPSLSFCERCKIKGKWKERRQQLIFLGVKKVWTDFKIGVTTTAIKSTEINAALN